MADDWPTYFAKALAAVGLSEAQAAHQAGLDRSVLSRWKSGQQPAPDSLRKIAPVIHTPLLDLMVVAGHLTPAEAGRSDVPQPPEVIDPVNPREQLIRDAALPEDITEELIENDREEYELLRKRIARLKAKNRSTEAG